MEMAEKKACTDKIVNVFQIISFCFMNKACYAGLWFAGQVTLKRELFL